MRTGPLDKSARQSIFRKVTKYVIPVYNVHDVKCEVGIKAEGKVGDPYGDKKKTLQILDYIRSINAFMVLQ